MEEKILYYLTPIFKVILFLIFIFMCLLPFGIITQFDFISIDKNSFLAELLLEGSTVLAVLGALLMIFKVFPTIDFRTVFVTQEKSVSGFLKGSLIGFLLIAFCAGLLLLNGNVVFSASKISTVLFLGYVLYFIIVAWFEELMFRSFPLFAFAERYPINITIILNSVLFGLIHLGNPGFNAVAMLNITLAGALFSIYTLQKRNISWAVGIHFGWNFSQGILLGYKVSGTDTSGLLLAKPVGQNYLSGGVFGIEGSIFCTIALSILIIWLLIRYKIEPIENVYEEDFEEESILE
ncbi:CPBP family intramembrane glutamic endopeptidase [Pedobacter boryungensis]|uniref:CPBP family intramembrane metalloprotease n=1 Tax=Pedobacter boryungensis TaxID=869962 RepID=A0ABX2D9M6_9SPHI|nr:type II CAAX endopeptidase family protein [Pedobacter boryungensis]NQX30690.1 CPBP family intramembrane metalloprotease [Pedobacter boryungensis]